MVLVLEVKENLGGKYYYGVVDCCFILKNRNRDECIEKCVDNKEKGLDVVFWLFKRWMLDVLGVVSEWILKVEIWEISWSFWVKSSFGNLKDIIMFFF